MKHSRLVRLVIEILVCIVTMVACSDMSSTSLGDIRMHTKYIDCHQSLIDTMQKSSFNGVQYIKNQLGDEAGAIITGSRYTEVDEENFTKYNIGYTVSVARFPDSLAKDNSEEFAVYKSNGYGYYMYDMVKVVNTFLNDDDGIVSSKELGFTKNIKSMRLAIPDKVHSYRRDVIDSIIYLITDGEKVTEENAAEVKEKLDKIKSISESITNLKHVEDSTGNSSEMIMIIPEYEYRNTDNYYPVYWDNVYAVPVTLCIENELTTNILVEASVNELKKSEKIFPNSYVRNSATNISTSSFYEAGELRTVDGQDNLAELLGDDYWK